MCLMSRIDYGWTHAFRNARYIANTSETVDISNTPSIAPTPNDANPS